MLLEQHVELSILWTLVTLR